MAMSSSYELLTPLITQLGLGFVAGFIVGYAIKKIAKVLAIILGLLFLGLMYLMWKGIIEINFDALRQFIMSNLHGVEAGLSELVGWIGGVLPWAGSFVVGFAIGLKKG